MSIEIASGLGEVLASAVEEGNPYRLTYNKKTKKVSIHEFANFSYSIQADPAASKIRFNYTPYRQWKENSNRLYWAKLHNGGK